MPVTLRIPSVSIGPTSVKLYGPYTFSDSCTVHISKLIFFEVWYLQSFQVAEVTLIVTQSQLSWHQWIDHT